MISGDEHAESGKRIQILISVVLYPYGCSSEMSFHTTPSKTSNPNVRDEWRVCRVLMCISRHKGQFDDDQFTPRPLALWICHYTNSEQSLAQIYQGSYAADQIGVPVNSDYQGKQSEKEHDRRHQTRPSWLRLEVGGARHKGRALLHS